jgi:predicted AlkP superfamily pyrophosphatase or phosphodiesterase
MIELRSVRRALLALALVGCRGTLDAPAAPASSPGPVRPRLAVLLVIDQLRPDALDAASLPGGLGRLVRDGRVFSAAAHDHGLTETCPGHVALGTGRHPGPAGIPSNEYIDPETGRAVYCVADSRPESAVFDAPAGRGVSPVAIRASALGDWVKAAHPGARVFSVAGKDRSAVALGGRRPDAAYWFDSEGVGRFTSSRYYMAELPEWVRRFSAELPLRMPPKWIHAPELGLSTPDDAPGESTRYGRTSGHPVGSGDPRGVGRQIYSSPFVDELTLAFARELIERERLGLREEAPDLLLISLSGHDVVGHMYGPESHEARDARLRIDARLGELLAFLELRSPFVVALSSDHGVLSLPEVLAAQGGARCPVPGGRAGFGTLAQALQQALVSEVGADAAKRPWLDFGGPQLGIDRESARAAGVEPERIVAALRKVIDQQPAVARTWTAAEIQSESSSEIAALYRNSLDPARPPDLLVQVAEGCLISTEPTGTTHGSPYAYDRAVPIVFWGTGITPGSDPRPARTVDVAPTLASQLGAAPSEPIDGRSLLPAPGESSR